MFHDILERKNLFLRLKNKKFKKSKIIIFPKRLVHCFGKKLWSFPSFYLRQNRAEKCVLRYSIKKKRFSKTIETRSLKGQKFVFSPKGLAHDFGQKLEIFPFFFILGNIGQENVFHDILEWINIFQDHKNNDSKKLKNWNFSEGV